MSSILPIHIFILCFNEAVILPHTIEHYRRYLPSASITIYDNESTDNSVELATNLGCSVVSFSSTNKQDEHIQQTVRNTAWSHITTGWVLALDMDEWLCITEQQLQTEYESGTSIITVKGVNMIGNSQTEDLSDIDVHSIRDGYDYNSETKSLCFLRDSIQSMNYSVGGHVCSPVGTVKYSEHPYINKHMDVMGLQYTIKKNLLRYERTHDMRKYGYDDHYLNAVSEITDRYYEYMNKTYVLHH